MRLRFRNRRSLRDRSDFYDNLIWILSERTFFSLGRAKESDVKTAFANWEIPVLDTITLFFSSFFPEGKGSPQGVPRCARVSSSRNGTKPRRIMINARLISPLFDLYNSMIFCASLCEHCYYTTAHLYFLTKHCFLLLLFVCERACVTFLNADQV